MKISKNERAHAKRIAKAWPSTSLDVFIKLMRYQLKETDPDIKIELEKNRRLYRAVIQEARKLRVFRKLTS